MAVRPVEEALRIEDLAVSSNENTDQSQKEDALKKELEGVRNLNRVMEGVITAMTKAKDNMDVHCLFTLSHSRWLEQQSRMQIVF